MLNLKTIQVAGAIALLSAGPLWAQNFTTAAEVRPILGMTKAQWVSVRPFDGKDLLYFTNLLSWRCGLDGISFAVNGGAPQPLKTEPCYTDESAPNALKVEGILPYVELPLDSVQTVTVTVTYDDGDTDSASFERAEIQIN